jgi:hypothetical protein
MKRLEQLRAYRALHGHCNVPFRGGGDNNSSNSNGAALGAWCAQQRLHYRRLLRSSSSSSKKKNGDPTTSSSSAASSSSSSRRMTAERIALLEQAGFQWEVAATTTNSTNRREPWNVRYEELRRFQRLTGHCNVPYRYAENKTLGSWVHDQRTRYRSADDKKRLSPEQIEKLESLGFQWKVEKGSSAGSAAAAAAGDSPPAWDVRFEQLGRYKALHGHCNVPYRYGENRSLGGWVHDQRSLYRRTTRGGSSGSLSSERIRKLESIGFAWTLRRTKKRGSQQAVTGATVATGSSSSSSEVVAL